MFGFQEYNFSQEEDKEIRESNNYSIIQNIYYLRSNTSGLQNLINDTINYHNTTEDVSVKLLDIQNNLSNIQSIIDNLIQQGY